MRQEALLCQLRRSWTTTTASRHGLKGYPTLLAGQDLSQAHQAWVADIPYVRLPTAFVYLACVVDAWSRRCVGWHLSRTIDTGLRLAALEGAIRVRPPERGRIHHSDRGVQYASSASWAHVTEIGAQISMSATGNPYDNGTAARFFTTRTREDVSLNQYATFADAEAQIGHFIDGVYHQKRRHAPIAFESLYIASQEHPSAVVW
jgi:transposase InsO family protein